MFKYKGKLKFNGKIHSTRPQQQQQQTSSNRQKRYTQLIYNEKWFVIEFPEKSEGLKNERVNNIDKDNKNILRSMCEHCIELTINVKSEEIIFNTKYILQKKTQ